MRTNMTLNQLKYAIAVSESDSFNEAAEAGKF